jgi:acyl-CoA thioesterase-1
MSRRMWTRAAPPPSERLTPRSAMAAPPKGSPNVSCMSSTERPAPSSRGRSYGGGKILRHVILRHVVRAAVCSVALLFALVLAASIAPADAETGAKPIKIVALGDSLTAGLGLPESEGFVARLQAALAAKGLAATVINAGVSGDTASDALARLDWSVPDDTDAVILEIGANDMLRGIKPTVTRAAIDTILQRLKERHIAVLLCGMRAAPNLGTDYGAAFESIYPDAAAKFDLPLYPFFLNGVAADLGRLQRDGLHPNAAGVDIVVAGILPQVEQLIRLLRERRSS